MIRTRNPEGSRRRCRRHRERAVGTATSRTQAQRQAPHGRPRDVWQGAGKRRGEDGLLRKCSRISWHSAALSPGHTQCPPGTQGSCSGREAARTWDSAGSRVREAVGDGHGTGPHTRAEPRHVTGQGQRPSQLPWRPGPTTGTWGKRVLRSSRARGRARPHGTRTGEPGHSLAHPRPLHRQNTRR